MVQGDGLDRVRGGRARAARVSVARLVSCLTRLTPVTASTITLMTGGTIALIVAAAGVLIAALIVVVRIFTEKRRSD